MPVVYDELWKLLIEKSMNKTELAEVAGLSSRTLAKLSKNQNVSTETVGRICKALRCDVPDIMRYEDTDDSMSVYDIFRTRGTTVAENEQYRSAAFSAKGRQYLVHTTKKAAGSRTLIHCNSDGTIHREDLYPSGISVCRTEYLLIKPELKKDTVTIVVISGKPSIITGLDDGIYRSSRNYGGCGFIYVMSAAAFKLFEP